MDNCRTRMRSERVPDLRACHRDRPAIYAAIFTPAEVLRDPGNATGWRQRNVV